MSGNTSRGYPYATASDPNDLGYISQALAEAINTDVGNLATHVLTTAALSLNALYTAFGAGSRSYHTPPQVWTRPNGHTNLRGLVKNVGTISFTGGTEYPLTATPFAAAYRPVSSLLVPVMSSHGIATLVVEYTGSLYFVMPNTLSGITAGNWYLSLDSVRWDAA